MARFGENKKMTERPEMEPKFSMRNKTDKYIVTFVCVALFVISILIAGAVILWYAMKK